MIFEFIRNIDYSLVVSMHGGNNLFLDSFAIILTSSLTWVPLYITLLYLIIKNNENAQKIFLILIIIFGTLLISNIFNNVIVKPWVARPRPLVNNALGQYIAPVNGYIAKNFSFYSSHTSNAFLIISFLIFLVRDKVLSIALLLWGIVIGWTRVYLGVHYPSDVLFGMFMGSTFGIIAYIVYFRLYKKISDHLHFISASYTRAGYSFADIDITLTIMVVTFIYAAFRAVFQV